MVDAFDLDLDASQWSRSTATMPSASANLGLRGENAWIGGVGVVSAARRQGIGETLMRALHDGGARAQACATSGSR